MILTAIKTFFVFICDDCGRRREQESSELPTEKPPAGHSGYLLTWNMVGRPPRLLCSDCTCRSTEEIHRP